MKFIVTLATELVDADTHAEAVEQLLEAVSNGKMFRASVCDMEVGDRQEFELEVLGAVVVRPINEG